MSSSDEQFCDSTTQVNTMSLGSAPAVGMANVQVITSQALGGMAQTAGDQAQQASLTQQVTTLQGLNSLISQGAASIGVASTEK